MTAVAPLWDKVARGLQRGLAGHQDALRVAAERAFVEAASTPALSRAMARLADLRLPAPVLRRLIEGYIRLYDVDMGQVAQPIEAFETFNDFFTRHLRDGARPIASGGDVIVSPADSFQASAGTIPANARLEQIKGRSYSVDALLGSLEDAAPFRKGVHATLYLSPALYHRVHCPVDGTIRAWRYIPGKLYPVNSIAVRQVDQLFAVNERVVVLIDSERFGPVAVVLVGAANVGRITLSFTELTTNTGGAPQHVVPPEPIPVRRGDELGVFNLGSTVVMLVADPNLALAQTTTRHFHRMGEPLWRKSKA